MTVGAFRPMTRAELDTAVGWAAAEGWNPGTNDAGLFWDTDPHGFVALDVEGAMAGSGSAVTYGPDMGFLGLFIVTEDVRGKGWGRGLWVHMIEKLESRLSPGAPIGLDGVIAMTDFYVRHGFRHSHDNIRMAGNGPGGAPVPRDASIVPITEVAFEQLVAADASHFGANREGFLRQWIAQPGSVALAAVEEGDLAGFAVRRRCVVGHKIGPLFARSPETAAALLAGLRQGLSDREQFVFDAPECNPRALALARANGMAEVFRCTRMYRGEAPAIDWNQIYGVTSFELG